MATVIGVTEVTVGTIVRVVLKSSLASNLFAYNTSFTNYRRSLSGSDATTAIPQRTFRRVVGFNRTNFLAQVLGNDTSARELAIEIEHQQPRRGRVYYQITMPYTDIRKLSRLVRGASVVDADEEAARRRQKRRVGSNDFLHPFDQYVPISLIR